MQRVAYGGHPSQFGELTLPDREPRGAVVVIHGGFWHQRYGLELGRPLAVDLAGHGLAVWNIEYRRVGGGGGWPSTMDDVLAAVDAVDLGPVVALGHSAGGHLAVYAAKHCAKVIGAVAQAGVLDFEAHPEITRRAAELLGGMPDEFPERYAAASPVRLVPIGKPVVCVHGDADEDVPVEQSTLFPNAEVHVLEGVGHMELIEPGTVAWERCREAVVRLVGACY